MTNRFVKITRICQGFGQRAVVRRVLQVIGKSFSVARWKWRLSDPVVLILGALLGLGLGLILLRGFIFVPGVPYYWDLQWSYSSHVFPMYYLWDEFKQAPVMPSHMLGYLFFYLFSAELSIRLLYIFLFAMMGMSMFYAVFKLTAARHPTKRVPLLVSTVATVVYVINPVICRHWLTWIFLWFYAFMPLLFYLSYAALKKINKLNWLDILKKAVVIALILFIMSPADRLPYYFILIPLAFLAGFSRPFSNYLKRSAVLIGLVLILYIVFCAVWIIPMAKGAFDPSQFWSFSRNWFAKYSDNTNLYLNFNLMYTNDSYNAFGFHISDSLAPFRDVAVVLLPALAFCALLLRRSKLVIWLVLFALMFIFLAKGTNPPFGKFYEWLACDSPIISSFGMAIRRPLYWNMPLMFCYTVLFSLTLSYLLGWIRDRLIWSKVKKVLFVIIFAIFLAAPFFTGLPLLTGNIDGAFTPIKIGDQYLSLMQWMQDDEEDFKMYSYPILYWWGSGKPQLPFGSRLEGSHQSLGYALVLNSLSDTLRLGELLSPWNMKYVVLDAYHVPEQNRSETFSLLAAQKDLVSTNECQGLVSLYVYENLADRSQIGASAQTIAVQGGLENMLSLIAIDSYGTLAQPMVFLDQEMTSRDCLSGAKTLISNQANLDLYLTMLDERYMVKPFELINDDPHTIWQKARARPTAGAEWTFWLNIVGIENWQSDYGVGIARSMGGPLNMSFEVDVAGSYDIFLRCIKFMNGGVLRVLLDNELIGDVSTKGNVSGFEWVKVNTSGLEEGRHLLTIDDRGGFNAVNLFAVLPSGELERYEAEMDDIVSTKRVVSIWEAETALSNTGVNVSDEYGGNASNGEVLTMPSGSRAWRNIEVVRDGEYRLAVRLAGDAMVKMDAQVVSVQSAGLGFAYTDPVHLEKGVHNIEITPSAGQIDLDVVWLYTVERENESVEDIFTLGEKAAQVVEFTKINPTKYRAVVNAAEPFMLSFAESYEKNLWVATVNGKEYPSIPLNSVVNGFWIEDQGELEITIEYKPQKYLYYGAVISVVGIVGALSFLIWDWRKKATVSGGSDKPGIFKWLRLKLSLLNAKIARLVGR